MGKDLTLFSVPREGDNARAIVNDALAGEFVTPEMMKDALITIEAPLPVAVSTAGALFLSLDATDKALADTIARLEARRTIISRLKETCKEFALEQCEGAEITRLQDTQGGFTTKVVKNPPKVVIDDVAALPAVFVTCELVETPDKAAIGAELKAGRPVPGAHLEQSKRIEFK